MADKAAAASQGGSKKKLVLFALAGLVVFGSGGVVGKVMLGGSKSTTKAVSHDEEAEQKVGETYQLEEFIVNLAGGEAYLKTTLALGLKEGVLAKKIEEQSAPVRDAIIEVLTSKSTRDISTPAGRAKLKEELVARTNEALPGNPVVKVYFVNFASQ